MAAQPWHTRASDAADARQQPLACASPEDSPKPVLQANEDVIYVVQAGFIGICGEWHADLNKNSYFYFDWKGPDKVNTSQFEDYAKVVDALLDAVPKSRQVALVSFRDA